MVSFLPLAAIDVIKAIALILIFDFGYFAAILVINRVTIFAL